MQVFNQAKAAGNQVFQVIHRKPSISSSSRGKTLEGVDGNIDIRDVYFAYPSRPEKLILQGFSLSIPAGKTVALVGGSGCGKSTFISLVARFYDPSEGLCSSLLLISCSAFFFSFFYFQLIRTQAFNAKN
jgi:ATP-binding cassette subfamily B (MDR/TAP) protein 1